MLLPPVAPSTTAVCRYPLWPYPWPCHGHYLHGIHLPISLFVACPILIAYTATASSLRIIPATTIHICLTAASCLAVLVATSSNALSASPLAITHAFICDHHTLLVHPHGAIPNPTPPVTSMPSQVIYADKEALDTILKTPYKAVHTIHIMHTIHIIHTIHTIHTILKTLYKAAHTP